MCPKELNMHFTATEALRTMHFTATEALRTMRFTATEAFRTMRFTATEALPTMRFSATEALHTCDDLGGIIRRLIADRVVSHVAWNKIVKNIKLNNEHRGTVDIGTVSTEEEWVRRNSGHRDIGYRGTVGAERYWVQWTFTSNVNEMKCGSVWRENRWGLHPCRPTNR